MRSSATLEHFEHQGPPTNWREMGENDHFVQFYEDDDYLVQSVSDYFAAGLREGGASILIGTRAHREAIDRRLVDSGIDLAQARAEDRYFSLDAAETLSKFMINDVPDEKLCQGVIEPILKKAGRQGRRIRAFGEMVALLCAQDNPAAALRLEELWSGLQERHTFALLCGYPVTAFQSDRHQEIFQGVCKEHVHVIPAESYSGKSSAEDRMRVVTRLQQQALSLEGEIAERKQMESNLRHEQARLAMAVSLAGVGIWELNIVSNEFTGSEIFKKTLGVAVSEPLSYDGFLALVHPEDVGRVKSSLRNAIANGSDLETEYRVGSSNGEWRWIAAMGRCFHNGSHRLLGVTLDITERKRAAEILERTVAERTAELQHSVAELEAFSYSISHDMRAPLRSMQGFAKILLEDCGEKLSPENYNYLERIATSAQRMDRLIQDVLTFSRVARNDLTLERVNLNHLVRGILECYPNLQPPQAEVVIQGTLPYVRGNAAALTQCLSNLLGNAVKFVRQGSQPRVRVWAEPGEENYVRLCIQDNGLGIAEEFHEKIFGIFQRLNKNYDGTGIGLAIVKKAADRMGARVGLKSALNEGSTFWLELKAVEPAA